MNKTGGLIATLLVATTMGCGSAGAVSEPERPSAAQAKPLDVDRYEQVEGYEADRERVPVAPAADPTVMGYVDRELMTPVGSDIELPTIAPIYETEHSTEVIAYWGYAIGWIDKRQLLDLADKTAYRDYLHMVADAST